MYLVTDESNPNAEKKYATRTLDSSEYTIYTTTQDEANGNYSSAVMKSEYRYRRMATGIVSGAKAFLIVFDEKTGSAQGRRIVDTVG